MEHRNTSTRTPGAWTADTAPRRNDRRPYPLPIIGRAGVASFLPCLLTALFLTASASAQNTFPITQSFETLTRGASLIDNDVWHCIDPTGLVVTATTGTLTNDVVFPAATHTNSAAFSAPVTMPLTGTGGRTKSYVEFMCKPVLGDEPTKINSPVTPEWALYFNAQGKVVIQHGNYSWDNTTSTPAYLPFVELWTDLTNSPVSSSHWVRVSIEVDYRTVSWGGGQNAYRFFRVSLNGEILNHPSGLKSLAFSYPPTTQELGGGWFFCIDADDSDHDGRSTAEDYDQNPPGQMDGFGMQGIGSIDDVFINDSTNVPLFDLTLASSYPGGQGTPSIPGTYSYAYGSTVECAVTNSPVAIGVGTQLVCTGWTGGSGTISTTGGTTHVTAVMEENCGLTWAWETQYQLDSSADSGGTVSTNGGWVAADSVVSIEALPDEGNSFNGWNGDVPSGQLNQNPLELTMNQARTIVATFATSGPEYTTQGTPYDWLEMFGVTNNHETADTEDWDEDGLLSWQEYVAGTDPTNAASRFAVLDQRQSGDHMIVDWYGTTNWGVTNGFGMYRSTNMTTWQLIVTGGLERAASGTNTWEDESPPTGAFYRPMIPASE